MEQQEEVYIDPDLPMEQQIAFLRQHSLNFTFDTFEVLRDKLGTEGVELFKEILRRGNQRIVEMTDTMDFETITSLAGFTESILGLKAQMDYSRPDAFQYTISYCPYWEECSRRGLDAQLCHCMEQVYQQAMNEHIGTFTEPRRMCDGDAVCTFRMHNTMGR